jgi:hypothetical protein
VGSQNLDSGNGEVNNKIAAIQSSDLEEWEIEQQIESLIKLTDVNNKGKNRIGLSKKANLKLKELKEEKESGLVDFEKGGRRRRKGRR